MQFNMCEDLIGALTIELIIEALKSRGFLQITDDHRVLCVENDWQEIVTPLWISNEFVGAASIDRSTDDALLGQVNIFRVKALTWQNENLNFDDHKAVAQVEFLLPGGLEITEVNFANYVSVDDKFAGPILNDLFVQTCAEML